jgi:hypothetical protein
MHMDYLKAEQLSTSKWRVLSIPFGGPFKGKDFDEEFFSIRTDIKPDWFDRRPAVWHHNLDGTMKADSTIGRTDDLELDEDLGWWSTLWLDRSHRYWAEVDKLLQAGKLYGSTGTLPNFAKTDRKTGEILVWPMVEQTLTPIPSNFTSQLAPSKAVKHFDEAGIDLTPATRGLLTDLDSPPAELPVELPSGGEKAAIQRVTSNPDRERIIRQTVDLATRVRDLAQNL